MTFEIVEAVAKILPVDLEKHHAILSRVVGKGSCVVQLLLLSYSS